MLLGLDTGNGEGREEVKGEGRRLKPKGGLKRKGKVVKGERRRRRGVSEYTCYLEPSSVSSRIMLPVYSL